MKPLRLEICAFGPFAGVETIDFSEIEGKSLLLIHGPTGSGKTTVLDAMCFALFGDTSGDERQAKQMRSDNAAATQTTSVTYDFSLGEKVFRVYRQPEQERAAKRGEGMTTEAHKATLWNRTKARSASDEGSVHASGAAKVSKAIAELFGFESEQFRQVVMLPQGKFRKLLTAESKEKEQILQTLFQTSIYGRVEKALLDKSNRLKREFQDDGVRMQAILKPAEVESIDELTTKIELIRVTHTEAKAAVPTAKQASESASTAFTKGKQDQEKLSEVVSAKVAAADLAKRAPEVEKLRGKRTFAQAARPLIELESNVLARQKEAAKAAKDCESASSSLLQAQAAKKLADEGLAKEDARELERDEVASKLSNLRMMSDSVGKLDNARQTLDAARLAETARTEDSKTAATLQETASEAVLALSAKREARDKESARVEGCELALTNANGLRAKYKKLVTAQAGLDAVSKKYQATQSELSAADSVLQAGVAAQELLEHAWQEGQAGALARSLVDGQACPVCGSAEHPSPASASESLPTEAEREQARQAVAKAREQMRRRQEAESEARSALSREEAALQSITEELGAVASLDLVQLDRDASEAQSALEKALKARADLLSLETGIQTAEETLTSAKVRGEDAAKKLGEAAIERARCAEAVAQLEEQVPEELRQEGALAKVIVSLTAQLEALKTALKKAQEVANTAAENLASAEQLVKGAEQQVEQTLEQAKEHKTIFEERRLQAGFDTESAYITARELVATLEQMETRIKEFDESRKAATDRLERAGKAAEGIEASNLDLLDTAAKEAAAKMEAAIRHETETGKELEKLVTIGKEHEKIRQKVASLEIEYGTVASLAKLANGQVAGHNISFQRFVLGALLDEVLLAATERLTRMSKGRYSLKRQPQSLHKGKAGGLDLEVVDTYTGVARPVTTLSGGESFLAALSLSLGLADVVQSYSGGIRLDTLFIDEGFGTLDASALDLALDTLTELNATGRLVGIISHVDELRTRIGTRLEVVASDGSSTTRFVGG